VSNNLRPSRYYRRLAHDEIAIMMTIKSLDFRCRLVDGSAGKG
jgi:hypothetical protein